MFNILVCIQAASVDNYYSEFIQARRKTIAIHGAYKICVRSDVLGITWDKPLSRSPNNKQ